MFFSLFSPLSFSLISPISYFLFPIPYSKFSLSIFFLKTLMLIVIVRQILVSLLLEVINLAMQNDIFIIGLEAL